MLKLKIGADPELFLKREGVFISAFEMVPGTKMHPYKVPKGAVQVDGMALEFNIDPTDNPTEFVYNINEVLKHLRNMVPPEFDFSFEAIAPFGKKYIEAQHPLARMLGCDPDFDAYRERANAPPDVKAPIRTAAGHVHLGWYDRKHRLSRQHLEECKALTKQLDFILGIPSLLLDGNPKRRELYGKAGAYRPKQYGVEYRVLSNFWLKNEKLMRWVFIHTRRAFTSLVERHINLFERYGNVARDIINNNQVDEARYFLKHELKSLVSVKALL